MFKQNQAEINVQEILWALDELKLPSTPTQIRDHMEREARERATNEANKKYESGEITKSDRDRHIKKFGKTMALRTIQRWLSKYTAYGYVAYSYNGYYLLAKGKREIQFRNFSKLYGTMALNSLIDLQFPMLSNDEVNLMEIINIFGVYVVYCLIEAARLIASNKNNNEEHWKSSYFDPRADFDRSGKFRERDLVNSWIVHVFNPINMLNIFLVAMSNSCGKNEKCTDVDDVVSRYFSYLEVCGMNTFKTSFTDQNSKDASFPPTTLDLVFKRVESSGQENYNEPTLNEDWKKKKYYIRF